MAAKKPKLLVFDLAYTLFPAWLNTDIKAPLKKGTDNSIVDVNGRKIEYYKGVPRVFEKLKNEGYKIGVASRTKQIQVANRIIKLFDWNKYIDYKEIRKGPKTFHFKNIQTASGISYEDMIFFDDEADNIREITQLGVLSILVEGGLTENLINVALEKFSSR